MKVNDAWVGEDNKLTPVPSLTDTGKAYYFYAKFIPTSLTISHSDIPLSSQNQTFLYEVSWVDGSTTRTVSVVVENNGSAKVVGFPVGTEVTVKPVNDWAWRSPDAEEESCEAVITSDKKGATVTFTYGASGDAWLGNDVYGTSLVGN